MTDWEDRYKLLLSEVVNVETKLIPLKSHIRGIAEYFQSKKISNSLDIANWFWMSSSINAVDFDGIKYDSAFMMCRPAYEYESEKQELHSNLMNELTRFLYVYSGFEALLTSLSLPNCPSNAGKINKAKNHIKINYTDYFSIISSYKDVVSLLRTLIKESSIKEYEKYFSIDACTDYNGVGLKVVYKLRNKLAHGDFNFPEPGDWSFKLPVEPEITKISTRIILISIQMIMLAENKGNFEDLLLYESEVIESDEFEDEWTINELSFLNTFHISAKEKIKSQLELDLK